MKEEQKGCGLSLYSLVIFLVIGLLVEEGWHGILIGLTSWLLFPFAVLGVILILALIIGMFFD